MDRRVLCAFCFVMLFMNAGGLATPVAEAASNWNFRPLQNADIVVRGLVKSVEEGTVPSADYWMLPEGAAAHNAIVTLVTLEINEVLRGPSVSQTWTFMVYQHPREVASFYPVGDEMLICAFYHSRLNMYYQTAPASRYLRTSGGWIAQAGAHDTVVGDAEVRQKVSQVAIDNVAQRAELVVEGVIESIDKSLIYGPDSTSAELVTISMRVERWKRGTVGGDHVKIVVIPRGRYAPVWRKDVPLNYEVGQRWLCMLKQNELGWYPFAGANGLLRVDGDELIYYERVPFWRTKQEVERAIQMTTERER